MFILPFQKQLGKNSVVYNIDSDQTDKAWLHNKANPIVVISRQQIIKEGQAQEQTPIETKSRRDVAQEYKAQLYDFANRTMKSKMSATDMARAHRALIRTLAPQMYGEGLRTGGVDPDEMDEADQSQIDGWVAEQLPYVRDFADAIATDKDENDVATRIDYWVNALNTLGNLAMASAEKNAMGTWELGATDHCQTCKSLNGQRHRVSWFVQKGFIPREPGSSTLECSGFNCACRIVDGSGKRLL